MGEALMPGAVHAQAQGKIDAARITQAANNNAQLTLVQAQKIVQAANNNASTAMAAANASVRASNNSMAQLSADEANAAQQQHNQQALALAEATKVVQAARNEKAASDSSLALWSQSLGNKRVLDKAGQDVNQITDNLGTALDGASQGTISSRLKFAGALGASMAAAAAAGIGGGSVEAYNQTLHIQNSFAEARQDAALRTGLKDAGDARANTMGSAIDQLQHNPFVAEMDHSATLANVDYTPHLANLDFTPDFATQDFTAFSPDIDYTIYVDHKKMSGLQQYLTFTTAATATYFGGPQAGMAVVNASNGIQSARNGDLNSASSSFMNAAKGFMGGFNTYRAGAVGAHSEMMPGAMTPTPIAATSGQAWGNGLFKSAGANIIG